MAKLTDSRKRFCDQYLTDLNATQAYLRAGYKVSATVAAVNARRLLENPQVQAYIQKRQQALQKKTEITQERILAELAAIGFSDATDFVEVDDEECVIIKPTTNMTLQQRAALAGIKQGRNGVEVRLHDKLRALDQLTRIMGYYHDSGTQPQTDDSGLQAAIAESAGEVFDDEVFEVQPEADASTDMVGTP